MLQSLSPSSSPLSEADDLELFDAPDEASGSTMSSHAFLSWARHGGARSPPVVFVWRKKSRRSVA
jgi:hypothetical protein